MQTVTEFVDACLALGIRCEVIRGVGLRSRQRVGENDRYGCPLVAYYYQTTGDYIGNGAAIYYDFTSCGISSELRDQITEGADAQSEPSEHRRALLRLVA